MVWESGALDRLQVKGFGRGGASFGLTVFLLLLLRLHCHYSFLCFADVKCLQFLVFSAGLAAIGQEHASATAKALLR